MAPMSGSSPRLRLLADDPSPCAGCHGRCCAEHPVNVDGFDLVRLMRAHAAPWQELVELTAVRHPLYFGFRLDRSAEHWMMWLRQKPDGACRFLVPTRRDAAAATRRGPARAASTPSRSATAARC